VDGKLFLPLMPGVTPYHKIMEKKQFKKKKKKEV